jgi:hypothetical protein
MGSSLNSLTDSKAVRSSFLALLIDRVGLNSGITDAGYNVVA